MATAPSQTNPSSIIDGVAQQFMQFLTSFSPADYQPPPAADSDEEAPLSYVARTIQEMATENETVLYIDYKHIADFDYDLADRIVQHYERVEPVLRDTLKAYMRQHHEQYIREAHGPEKEFFVGIHDLQAIDRLRDLRTEHIGKLSAFSGTITRTSDVRPELFLGTFRCQQCGTEVRNVEQFYKFTEPIVCPNQACNNKKDWTLLRDDSIFVDWQRLKVQENVEEIPGGSLPRTIDVILRANNVDRAKPGDKVTFTGSLVVCPDVSALTAGKVKMQQAPTNNDMAGEGVVGLKELGAREMSYRLMFVACSTKSSSDREGVINIRPDVDETPQQVLDSYSEAHEAELRAMRDRGPGLFDDLARSICPAVYGCESVKKAVLLMLMGGVHKVTAEGINLRGDINVAIIGDPSTAKSQMLKYVSGFLPRAVYTSGKASTAAGLTASVVREPENNEFAIEAGALMLADNGICCIDEFDKMDVGDQVAIHEAMEQQTISISKAGIQATLNARTSILAAANPRFGRYDKGKSTKDNINLPPAILSRFDLLHVMLDELTEEDDGRIAAHIVALHKDPAATIGRAPFTMEQLQRYIKYARSIKPRITAEAQATLVRSFKRLRGDDAAPGSHSAYRITVRQLEALVRLSEAIARVHLSTTVTAEHVAEATKLLEASILKVDVGDIELDEDELAAEMAANQGAAADNPDLEDIAAAHGLARNTDAADGVGAADGAAQQQQQQGGDAEMQDAQQENIPPAASGQQQQQQASSQGGDKQQQQDGSQKTGTTGPATTTQQQQQSTGGAGTSTQQQQSSGQQPKKTVSISADKYEFVKNMLLRRLWEVQQQQERERQEQEEAAAAAATAGSSGMDVDGATPATPLQRAGLLQKDLVDWYITKQIERGAIADMSAAECEYDLVFKVIGYLLKKEGLVTVTGAPKRAEGEGEGSYRERLLKERRLTLSANFVPE